MSYVLVSYYNTGQSLTHQRWSVYAWIDDEQNHHIKDHDNEQDALMNALSFRLPIMKGSGDSVGFIAGEIRKAKDS